jgi:hypothetical protein
MLNSTVYFLKLYIFFTAIIPLNAEDILVKYGVVYYNSKPVYIQPKDLVVPRLIPSKKRILEHIDKHTSIIRHGVINWYPDRLEVYDANVKYPGIQIWESETDYHYQVKDNKMYLSKDGKTWERLYIDVVKEIPPEKQEREAPLFMIIHLKCKWFEGEYEVFGTSG